MLSVEFFSFLLVNSPYKHSFYSALIDYYYRDNAVKLNQIIKNYVENYVNNYYPDDQNLLQDQQVNKWFRALDKYTPNGIKHYTPKLTKENLVKLITTFIYTATVEHEKAGGLTYNYLPWHQHIPFYVKQDGTCLSTIGQHQSTVNTLFITNAASPRLSEDLSQFALDANGAKIMKQFTKDMLDYQRELDANGVHPYTLCPKNLESSIAS